MASPRCPAAQQAFVAGMHLTAGIAAVVAVCLAAMALVALRNERLGDSDDGASADATEEPERHAQPIMCEPEGAA
jgi:hypothetical protein